MDALAGYALARAAIERGDQGKVFDWNKAAQLLRERGAGDASAGLSEDWFWTGGEILRDGKPVPRDETYTYLSSMWATPQLRIGDEHIDCFLLDNETEWTSETYWPESALAILNATKPDTET